MTYQAESRELLYSDPEAGSSGRGSHKYYRSFLIWDDADPTSYRVVFQWGRVGSNAQSQTFGYLNEYEATKALMKKLHEKIDKGYVLHSMRNLDVVPSDIAQLAGVPEQPANGRSQDRIQLLLSDIDRCRRLAMSTKDDVVEAITLRNEIRMTVAELQRSLVEADGQMEIIQTLLTHKLESV